MSLCLIVHVVLVRIVFMVMSVVVRLMHEQSRQCFSVGGNVRLSAAIKR